MLKRIKSFIQGLFASLKWSLERRQSERRATNLAVRLTITGALTPFPPVSRRVRAIE